MISKVEDIDVSLYIHMNCILQFYILFFNSKIYVHYSLPCFVRSCRFLMSIQQTQIVMTTPIRHPPAKRPTCNITEEPMFSLIAETISIEYIYMNLLYSIMKVQQSSVSISFQRYNLALRLN